jgi:hypothetical protein
MIRDELELPFEVDVAALRALPADQQTEELAKIEALRELVTRNPLWRLKPHEGEAGFKRRHGLELTGRESRGQVEYLELDARDIYIGAVVAGNRFGKTHINVARCALQTLPWDFIPPWLHRFKTLDPAVRDVRYILAGPNSTTWLPTVLLPKLRALLPAEAMWRGDVDSAFNAKDRILRFADGSYWNVVTYDMDLKAWAGQEADGVCFDEEPAGEDGYRKYEEAVGRTIDRDGTQRFTLTPVEGIGWLYEILADPEGEPRHDADVHVVTGNIDHNPNISERGKERAKAQWARRPTTYDARTSGRWTHREGLIFPEFVPAVEEPPGAELAGGHYRPDRELRAPGPAAAGYPQDHQGRWLVPVFETIDPGINEEHPFAFSVSFLNTASTDVYGQDDVLETFYAFKSPELNVDGQAEVIHQARLRLGYKPTFTTIDPAARNRNPETGRRLQDAFRKRGIYTVPGQNDRALTYDAIKTRLVGRRWVIWHSLAPLLGDELTKYRWKGNRGRVGDAPRPEPIKRNDDLIDGIRYMVVRIPVWRGETADPLAGLGDEDPRRRLLRDSIEALRPGRRKGKVGGVW